MTSEQFFKLSYDDRIDALLTHTILDTREEINALVQPSDRGPTTSTVHLVSFSSDYLRFYANIRNNPKIVSFSIPYDKGWKVYVDGIQVKPQEVNISMLGLKLDAGKHEIELKYIPPGFLQGCGISAFTLIILATSSYFKKIGRRH